MGTIFLNTLIATLLFSSLGFSQSVSSSRQPAEEISLSDDRKHLDEIRKEIPEDIRKENDELAFVLKLFEDKSRDPNKISSEFNRRLTRYRNKKQKHFRKLSKEYTKIEKKKRKQFLDKAKKERKKFLDSNPSREARNEFFAEERSQRSDFFSEERENRQDFESELRAQRKEFEQDIRSRREEFKQKLQEFRDLKQAEKKQSQSFSQPKKSSELSSRYQNYLKDFDEMPREPGETLAPKEEP